MPVPVQMTAEQFDALPEEEIRKWELLDGELIEVPSATLRHGATFMRLSNLLQGAAGGALLETYLAVRANTRLRPDFVFFSVDTWQSVDRHREPVVQKPDIIVEIVSPSEFATTIRRKLDAYLKWGVQEVWLIEPAIHTLELHTLAGMRRLREGAFLTSELIPGFRVQIADLFENL